LPLHKYKTYLTTFKIGKNLSQTLSTLTRAYITLIITSDFQLKFATRMNDTLICSSNHTEINRK